MKLKTQMQKANVVTVSDGIIQAQHNGVLYQDYDIHLAGSNFAVNAKQFFEGWKVLKPGFRVFSKEKQFVTLVDEEQVITLTKEMPDDLVLPPPRENNIDLTPQLNALAPYAAADFPAFFCTETAVEVLHPQMIVRAAPFEVTGVFSVTALPTHSDGYSLGKEGLWIYYGKACVCLGKLDISKPDTDSYFEYRPELRRIPGKILGRWVKCLGVRFEKTDLCLLPNSRIEMIKGQGEYDPTLFHKVIKNATDWAMDDKLLYFGTDKIRGVLENEQGRD